MLNDISLKNNAVSDLVKILDEEVCANDLTILKQQYDV